MATKKLQNFVKSKVNTNTNVSIAYSKTKLKLDSSEEPLIFETFESDSDIQKEKNTEALDIDFNVHETDDLKYDDFEVVSNEIANVQPVAMRDRVGNLGKSVNTVFKDCQNIFGTIGKAPQKKKSARKASEVTKSRSRFSTFRRKGSDHHEETIEENTRSKSLSRENEDENVNEFDCPVTTFVNAADNPGYISDEPRNSNFIEEIQPDPPITNMNIDASDSQDKMPSQPEIIYMDNKNSNNLESEMTFNFSSLKIISAIVGLFAIFFFFSISKFIFGLICGMLMSFGIFKIYESFFLSSNGDDLENLHKTYPRLRSYPNPLVPHIEERAIKDEFASPKASFSTWVNSVDSYNPNWNNMSAAYTLHISLESTKLRMRRPKNKISNRVLGSEHSLAGTVFVSERTVDLLHSKVHLLPFGLVKRRMWSKKYPICISLNMPTISEKPKKQSFSTLTHSRSADNLEKDQLDSVGSENLCFFTRTCREKEEVFRRLMAASLGMPINLTISEIVDKYLLAESQMSSPVPLININETKEDDNFVYTPTIGWVKQAKEDISTGNIGKKRMSIIKTPVVKEPQIVTYVRYMAKFMPSDSFMVKMKSKNLQLNYVECDLELLWLNALIGRFAWDVFRGNFWIKVIREKIQKKLKKIQLPYFIDQLEVTDIELGTELPVIRKVSRPYMDFRGLWVEFEVVYSGGFSMGLETKINLMRLKAHGAQQKSTNNTKTPKINNDTVKHVPETANNDEVDNVSPNSIPEPPPLTTNNNLSSSIPTPLNLVPLTSDTSETESCPEINIATEATLNSANSSPHFILTADTPNVLSTNDNAGSTIPLEDRLRFSMTTGGGSVAANKANSDFIEDISGDESFDSNGSESDENLERSFCDFDTKNFNYAESAQGQVPGQNKSFMNWVDRLTRSTYFQKASENKYVLKTMEYVSNTSLALQVNAHYLNGILVLNIPPPPSDRLWWGFKKDPDLVIKVKPKVGQKEIQMTKIVEFIEKKLIQEFKRVAVLPNMDDIAIPLLSNGNPDKYNQNLL